MQSIDTTTTHCNQTISRWWALFAILFGILPSCVQLVVNYLRFYTTDEETDTLIIVSNLLVILDATVLVTYLVRGHIQTGGRAAPCRTNSVTVYTKMLWTCLVLVQIAGGALHGVCIASHAEDYCIALVTSPVYTCSKAFSHPLLMLTLFIYMLYDDLYPGHDESRCRAALEAREKKTA